MSVDLLTFEPATATVLCGGERHTIRWEAGELFADNHGEPEGELALAALGGTSVSCLDVLSAWRRLRCDHRLLTCLTRGAGDYVVSGRDQYRPGRAPVGWLHRSGTGRAAGVRTFQMMANAQFGQAVLRVGPGQSGSPMTAGEPTDAERLETLCQLGGTIPWRLAASVTLALLEPSGPGHESGAVAATAALTASLFGRARATLASWCGDPDLSVDLKVIDPGEPPRVHRRDDDSLGVALPLTWVADVWGRGLAVVGERFTVAVLGAGPDGVVMDTVGRELGGQRQVTITS